VMVPVDHLLLPEAAALPAIVVVRQAQWLDPFCRGVAAPRACSAGDGPWNGAALAHLPTLPRRTLCAYPGTPCGCLACLGRER
jgi:hypothetical protein